MQEEEIVGAVVAHAVERTAAIREVTVVVTVVNVMVVEVNEATAGAIQGVGVQ